MMTTLALLALLGQGIPTEAEARKAEAKLADKPDDPAANLIVGKYLAWAKSDWSGAAEFVARGSDPILKKAFQADAAGGKTGPEMIGVGDEWVAAGDKRTDMKKLCRERALFWYAKAWPLVEDPWKTKLRLQLRKLACPPPGSEKSKKSAGNPYGWSGFHMAYLEAGFSRSGARSIRLIPSQSEKSPTEYSSAYSKSFPVSSGMKVRATAWGFTDGTDKDSHIDIRFFDAGGKFLGQRSPIMPQDSPWWQKVSGELEAPADSFRVDIQISMTAWSGVTWVDDVTLEVDGREILLNGGFEK